ncbi:LANO_0F15764g1_1 [Lachancea nothofagi CBS 11611]|uniref:LANO_0F15764g1_1 n=1 Tax=Lachancea nothofagi CBS 11611 TaxID=1266666 RepID=A0A1G4KCQ7_9SACH|nr:LANO_0F15764g1_1 [Lachancea nothofagi CBS 11611]
MRRKSAFFYPFIASAIFICLVYHVKSSIKVDNNIKPLTGAGRTMPTSTLKRKPLPHQMYQERVKACLNYMEYASIAHFRDIEEKSPLNLPFQRPPVNCRTFESSIVEKFLPEFTKRLKDRDLAKLFENCFPNTLDTTILWHVSATMNRKLGNHKRKSTAYRNELPETFVVTGDIHAEWLRDSAWQLSVYQPFIKHDFALRELIKGAINTQSQLIMENPFCNAFNPPPYCPVKRAASTIDKVHPTPDWNQVFECKYEVDSLASFLTLSRQFYENAPEDEKFSFVNTDWILAVTRLVGVISAESSSTFDGSGAPNDFPYTFQRDTNVASETLPLAGTGNPVNSGTGLVRSAFRPSDDSTIFQFFIPGNAYLSVELEQLSEMLSEYQREGLTSSHDADIKNIAEVAAELSARIREGVMKHGVVNNPKYGKVFAYEVDGFGSFLLMDDANIPSLLSLPELGFIGSDNDVYQNTRRMITCKEGNPYFIEGSHLQGIGGPHIGIHNVWPLSLIVAVRTSNSDQEIVDMLNMIIQNTGGLGLIHESIQAFKPDGLAFTRPWFAWANSEFAKTILHLAETRPHLIFRKEFVNERFRIDSFLLSLESDQ